MIHRTILLSICKNIIFIKSWIWLSTVLLTCMQYGCDKVRYKMLFCLKIIRCFVFHVCLFHERALFKPKQHHTSHWISYRLSYSASSSCESEFVFGAWDLDSTPIAFTSALKEVITTNSFSTTGEGVVHLHKEERIYTLWECHENYVWRCSHWNFFCLIIWIAEKAPTCI